MFQEFGESGGGGIDMSKPSLAALAYDLRHLPDNFRFSFFDCHKCAMGRAHILWPEAVPTPNVRNVSKALGINENQARELFVLRNVLNSDPEDIAADIDKLVPVLGLMGANDRRTRAD